MSLESAKKYLEEKGYADHVIELEESKCDGNLHLGVEQGMIAKTTHSGMLIDRGTSKVDNQI